MANTGLANPATPDAAYELVFMDGPRRGEAVSLPSGRFTLGSDAPSTLRLPHPSIAAVHAEFAMGNDGALWVKDLAGTGKTKVNSEPVQTSRLEDGAFLTLGEVELCIRQKGGSGRYGTAIRPASGVHGTGSGAEAAPASGESGQVLASGAVIAGRYKVIDKLAEGGMGEVYKAEHVELGKLFALKVMKRQFGLEPDFVERFKREAIAAGRIGQLNIVDVSDFGRTEDGRFYFVMEFLDGVTLADLLRRNGAQPVGRVLRIMTQMCRALRAAHQRGIVHRDLKPENVILLQREDQPDFVKVVDFGVAKVQTGGAGTQVGLVVGTPAYMSPEQAGGLQLDARTDIYSTGLIIYELLSGRPPFEGMTPSLQMAAHIYKPPPPLQPAQAAGAVPQRLLDLVGQMMAKSPGERPASMGDVIEVLEACLDEVGERKPGERRQSDRVARISGPVPAVTGRPAGPTTGELAAAIAPKKPIGLWVVGAVLVTLALGAGAYFALSKGHAEKAEAVVVAPVPVPPPAPAPAPPAAAPPPAPAPAVPSDNVKLSLISDPPNAEVYDGDALLGRTPMILDWKKGKRGQFRFELEGYSPKSTVAEPMGDMPIVIKLSKPVAAKKKRAGSGDDDLKGLDDF